MWFLVKWNHINTMYEDKVLKLLCQKLHNLECLWFMGEKTRGKWGACGHVTHVPDTANQTMCQHEQHPHKHGQLGDQGNGLQHEKEGHAGGRGGKGKNRSHSSTIISASQHGGGLLITPGVLLDRSTIRTNKENVDSCCKDLTKTKNVLALSLEINYGST